MARLPLAQLPSCHLFWTLICGAVRCLEILLGGGVCHIVWGNRRLLPIDTSHPNDCLSLYFPHFHEIPGKLKLPVQSGPCNFSVEKYSLSKSFEHQLESLLPLGQAQEGSFIPSCTSWECLSFLLAESIRYVHNFRCWRGCTALHRWLRYNGTVTRGYL